MSCAQRPAGCRRGMVFCFVLLLLLLLEHGAVGAAARETRRAHAARAAAGAEGGRGGDRAFFALDEDGLDARVFEDAARTQRRGAQQRAKRGTAGDDDDGVDVESLGFVMFVLLAATHAVLGLVVVLPLGLVSLLAGLGLSLVQVVVRIVLVALGRSGLKIVDDKGPDGQPAANAPAPPRQESKKER
jgi:hypothetical protein